MAFKTVYHSNGQIRCKAPPILNNQWHGIERWWYDNGQLHFEIQWQNDQIHGIEKGWYESGKLSYKKYFLYGEEVSEEEYEKHELIEKLACLK